jgi:glycerophosphoryl diester phosphodiesterase
LDHPFFQGLTPTVPIAHRGGALRYPENTQVAFEAAARLGARMIETDVHLSADGEVIVWHDDTLDRCSDASGLIADRTAAELARIDAGYRFTPDEGLSWPYRGQGHGAMRLADLLSAMPDMRFNIDLKPNRPELVSAFVQVLEAAQAVDRVCMGSEHDSLAATLHAALPDACHFFPRNALTAWIMAALTGQPLPDDDRWTVLDMPMRHNGMVLTNAQLVQAAAADDRWINVWTIDDPADMRTLIELGIGGIMTDRPKVLAEVLAQAASA